MLYNMIALFETCQCAQASDSPEGHYPWWHCRCMYTCTHVVHPYAPALRTSDYIRAFLIPNVASQANTLVKHCDMLTCVSALQTHGAAKVCLQGLLIRKRNNTTALPVCSSQTIHHLYFFLLSYTSLSQDAFPAIC